MNTKLLWTCLDYNIKVDNTILKVKGLKKVFITFDIVTYETSERRTLPTYPDSKTSLLLRRRQISIDLFNSTAG